MHWHVGPWVWNAPVDGPPPCWQPPAGTLAALDLRTLPEMSVAGGTPGKGLFLASARLGADYDYLGAGSWYDLKPSLPQRRALAFRQGQTAAGDDLVGMVLSLFSDEADPQGLDRPKPLVPTVQGRLELHVGQRHAERWRWNRGRGANRVKALLRREFAELMADAEAGRLRDAIHHRRVLDFWCEKYGVEEWQEFVPGVLQPLVPGRVPHETTITESFNKADGDTLGPDLSWTELAGDADIQDNQLRIQAAGITTVTHARAESDLSGDDNYAQITWTGFYVFSAITSSLGSCARYSSSADTCYMSGFTDSTTDYNKLYKRVSAVNTELGASGSITLATGVVYKTEANGSAIKAFRDATEDVSVTDTAISSGIRAGVWGWRSSGSAGIPLGDSFEAGDLAGGGGGITYTQLERGLKGYCRGMYVGRI